MTLVASAEALRARRSVAAGPLEPLAASLAAELRPLLESELFIPREKALLSRTGGRCPRDGVYLEFDPFSRPPHKHRCPACGDSFDGELHDRFWIYWYQLWLVERAVHAAMLALLGRSEFAALASRILDRYGDLYLEYPNRDNVLGPTRLFFSTYLESIWLLNLSIALDLLELHTPAASALGQRVRERVIEPSAALITSYDEGGSNRQVWNDAALLAANRLLGRPADAERAVHGPSGIVSHLERGLLRDGTWYEGENYHLFAHRGLWYGVTMAENAGITMPSPLLERFGAAFATPFLTALPDMTLPARRDSQYAISLRQSRFAELCELGLARTPGSGDSRLMSVLKHLYEPDIPRGDTGRARSTADVERNLPATRLSRADLGWRSLLFARPTLPALESHAPGTVLLEAQGIAVFRRDRGRSYAALDYGSSGGGHGHPDRLNLLLASGLTRWLDDFGTGSYVDPSLHWYRSTLAHNAPFFERRSQQRADGKLLAFEEKDAAGWIEARVDALAPGVTAHRTLVVMEDYLIDELTWHADRNVTIDLPLHVDAELVTPAADGATPTGEPLAGGDGLEDGFRFLHDAVVLRELSTTPVRLRAQGSSDHLDVFAHGSEPAQWWRAVAPGPPGGPERRFVLLRSHGSGGSVRLVWSWRDAVASVHSGDTLVIGRQDGSVHIHSRTVDGWLVDMRADDRRTMIQLGGRVAFVPSGERSVAPSNEARRDAPLHLPPERSLVFDLGEAAYRRSEQSWAEAGRPNARVALRRREHDLVVDIDVCKPGELTFVLPGAANPLDNEEPDINGDGVQLYVAAAAAERGSGWLLTPDQPGDAGGTVRARPIAGWPVARTVHGTWERTNTGYHVRVQVDIADVVADGGSLAVEVIVNEMPLGRTRRRGQLLLSGGAGEFVYLRGDRQDRERLTRIQLVP